MSVGMVQQSYNTLFVQGYASSKTESADASSRTNSTDGSFAESVEAKTSELTSAEVSKYPKVADKEVDKSQMDPLDYYHELCKEYSDVTFRLSDRKALRPNSPNIGYNDSFHQSGANFSYMGHTSISIDISIIRKMQDDPEYELRIKQMIEGCCVHRESDERNNLRFGMKYMCYSIEEDEKGEPTDVTISGEAPWPTEEEIKARRNENQNKDLENIRLSLGINDMFFEMLDKAIEKSRENAEERKEDMRHDEMQKKTTANHQNAVSSYEASFMIDAKIATATFNL